MGCGPSKPDQVTENPSAHWAVRRDEPVQETKPSAPVTHTKVATCGLADLGNDISDVEEVNSKRKVAPVLPLGPISSGNAQEAPQISNSPRIPRPAPHREECLPGLVGVIEPAEKEEPSPARVIPDNQIREGSILAETRKKFDAARYQQQQVPINTWTATPSTSSPPPQPVVSPPHHAHVENDMELICVDGEHSPSVHESFRLPPAPAAHESLPKSTDTNVIPLDDAECEHEAPLFEQRKSISDATADDIFGEDDEQLMKEIMEEFDL